MTVQTARIPLSFNQEFLCAFDKGDVDGAFGHRHTLAGGWRLSGRVDTGTLRAALRDLVARHEMLRTTVTRGEDRAQTIHPPAEPVLVIRDLAVDGDRDRDSRAEELLNDWDAMPFPVTEQPLLRAVLGLFDDTDSVLVLTAHHTVSDAWSLQVLIRDLAEFYAARAENREPRLPKMAQYQEFAVWQQTLATDEKVQAALAYWRAKLDGAEILAIPADRPKTAGTSDAYAVHRFVIGAEQAAGILDLARTRRSSPFIVVLAAYNVLLHKMTGATDIVVPTFTSGRYQERFLETVGPFFNFVPLRTDLAGCGSFGDVLDRTRQTCLDAYAHDIPFALVVNEVPAVIRQFAEPELAVAAFEMLQSPESVTSEPIGGVRYTELRRRVRSQSVSSAIPDGLLWALDVLPSGELAGSLKFNSNLFDESTITGIVSGLRELLRTAVTGVDRPLSEL